MERRLPIYQLTPEASSDGTRMMVELLSPDIAAQRAKRRVSHFPSDTAEL